MSTNLHLARARQADSALLLLQSVLAMSKDVSPDTARSLLGSFDVTRFAVMAVEGAFGTGDAATEEGEGSGTSSSAPSGGKVGRDGWTSQNCAGGRSRIG